MEENPDSSFSNSALLGFASLVVGSYDDILFYSFPVGIKSLSGTAETMTQG